MVSAHAPEEVDWAAHKGIDTLVLLMAGATLRESIGCMLNAGWAESTPVDMLAMLVLLHDYLLHACSSCPDADGPLGVADPEVA